MARQLSTDDPVVHVEGEAIVEDHELIYDDDRVPAQDLLPPPGPLASGDASTDPTRIERPMRMVEQRTRPRVNTLPFPVPVPAPPLPHGAAGPLPHEGRTREGGTREGGGREGEILAGKYYVVRALGRAGNGMVLLVRHVDLGQHLFFKFLPREVCAFPDTVARFMRGARAALQLTSEHAARTLDAGRLGSGIPYVVTEFLEGSDLRDVVRVRGALPIPEAVDLVLQAAEAVADAHRHGVVHGNLNPSTLFVSQAPDGSPRVKVMDFGVGDVLRADPVNLPESRSDSRDFEDPGRAIEALSCAAPEQLRRAGDVDPRTDIWALGAILHEALTGFPAYYADSISGMLAMIVADPAPPLTSHRPDAPAPLENVILRCFEKERSGRYASVAEFAVALKQFASPESEILVDRIIRTLGRGGRVAAAAAVPSPRALVHIKSSPPPPPVSAPPVSVPVRSNTMPLAQRYQLVWSAALIAFGLFGGVVAGSLITRPVAAPVVASEQGRSISVESLVPARVAPIAQPANAAAMQQPAAAQPVAVAEGAAVASQPGAVPMNPALAPVPAVPAAAPVPAVAPGPAPAFVPQPAARPAFPRVRAEARPRQVARAESDLDDESLDGARARSKASAVKTAAAEPREPSTATTLFDDVR